MSGQYDGALSCFGAVSWNLDFCLAATWAFGSVSRESAPMGFPCSACRLGMRRSTQREASVCRRALLGRRHGLALLSPPTCARSPAHRAVAFSPPYPHASGTVAWDSTKVHEHTPFDGMQGLWNELSSPANAAGRGQLKDGERARRERDPGRFRLREAHANDKR